METSLSNSHQTFGRTEATNGSHLFQGVVNGSIHHHWNAPELQNSQPHIFDDLPLAAFNSTGRDQTYCLPGTRKGLLEEIRIWANGDATRRVYWLEGMAGTGKSTIALTVARDQYERRRLGASFFFTRGGGGLASARSFAATIASQLREFSPELKKGIDDAAMANPRIQTLTLYDQWKKLVIEPLSRLTNESISHPLVIVIDALDECDEGASYGDKTFSVLVQCLKDVTTIESVEIRVFATSRPHGGIKMGFDRILNKAFRGLILQDIEKSIVDEDLTIFYKEKLGEAADWLCRPDLRCSDEAIKHLVEKSHGLFIHAATICRFILNGKDSAHDRLLSLLATGNNSVKAEIELDKLYTTVLESSSTVNPEAEERQPKQELFHRIIGSIVILFDVMTISDLAMMLQEPKEQVLTTLNLHKSVIDVPESNLHIRLLHPSFRDFLLDSTRCRHSSFSIDPREAHGRLFRYCLRIMKEHLRRNMCSSSQPATNARNHISKSDMEMDIPVAVQYASCYWIRHLQQSTIDPTGDTDVLEFFQYRFLYWLETLALIGRLSDALVLMEVLGKMVSIPNTKPQSRRWLSKKLLGKSEMLRSPRNDVSIPLNLVLDDAKRFLRSHISIIENAPLQLYSSAMMFSPTSSITKQRYYHELSNWTLSKPGLTEKWESHLQQFICPYLIRDVAFSHDGGLLCVGLGDGDVHLCEIATGIERKVLSTNKRISALVLSSDGSLMAIGFRNGGVSLWDLTTLSLLHSLEAEGSVIQVAFSPSGNVVASCFTAVHQWDVNTGLKLHTLIHQDATDDSHALDKLSLDCTSLTFGVKGNKIELRDTVTGATRWPLQGDSLLKGLGRIHPYGGRQVSPNGNLIVVELESGPVTWALFDIATGKKRVWKPFKSEEKHFRPLRFAFSPDSELIAVSNSSGIEIFHIKTWKMLARRDDCEGAIQHISFSPNSQLLACWNSRSVSLWDITTCERWHTSGSRTQKVIGRISSVNGNMFESFNSEFIFRNPKTHKSQTMKMKSPREGNNFPRIAVSLDGKLMASAWAAGRVYLCDTGTGALKHTFHAEQERRCSTVKISPNGVFVAFAPTMGVVSIWDSTTGKRHHQVLPYDQSPFGPEDMAFSPDSRLIAFGFWDGVISIWEIEHDTACARTEFCHSVSRIKALAFSPDTKLLASGSDDSQLCLWDTTTGTKRWALQGSPKTKRISGLVLVAFSHDGELVASAFNTGSVTLWHVKSGTIHQTVTTGGDLNSLFFSDTGFLTDRGPLPLSDNSQSIFVSEDWIMVGEQRVVYIPPDYRESLAFVSGDTVGFLDSSGQVQTFRYNLP